MEFTDDEIYKICDYLLYDLLMSGCLNEKGKNIAQKTIKTPESDLVRDEIKNTIKLCLKEKKEDGIVL